MTLPYNSLKCFVCYDLYNLTENIPRIIPSCGHTLCSTCLNRLLQVPGPFKCPLDHKGLTPQFKKNIEYFPINFAIQDFLEERKLSADVCKIHEKDLEYICVTDRVKVCSHCAICADHSDKTCHNVKPVIELKTLIGEKKNQLKVALENMDQHYKTMEEMLEKTKTESLKLVQKQFQELTFLVRAKEREFTVDLNNYFREKLTSLKVNMSKDSSFRKDVIDKIKNYEGIMTHPDPFALIDQDISNITAVANQSLLQETLQSTTQDLDHLTIKLTESLSTQINLLEKLTIFGKHPDTIYAQIIEETAGAQDQLVDADDQIFSSLGFKLCENETLEITSTSGIPEGVSIPVKDWIDIKTMTFQLNTETKFSLDKENLKALCFIRSKLTRLETVHILAKDQHQLPEDLFISLFSVFSWKPQHLKSIRLDLGNTNIGDQSLLFLSEKIFSKLSSPISLSIFLPQTNITDRGLNALAKVFVPFAGGLQRFEIGLSGTSITEESLLPLFVSMPSVETFSLLLESIKLSPECLEALNVNTLASLERLTSLKINLRKTCIGDNEVKRVLESIPNVQGITELLVNVSGNNITDGAIQGFVDIRIPSMENLKKLDLFLSQTMISKEIKGEVESHRKRLSKERQ